MDRHFTRQIAAFVAITIILIFVIVLGTLRNQSERVAEVYIPRGSPWEHPWSPVVNALDMTDFSNTELKEILVGAEFFPGLHHSFVPNYAHDYFATSEYGLCLKQLPKKDVLIGTRILEVEITDNTWDFTVQTFVMGTELKKNSQYWEWTVPGRDTSCTFDLSGGITCSGDISSAPNNRQECLPVKVRYQR